MDIERIGKIIKDARVSKGMTQTNLAEVLMVSDKAVSKWERGICCPDISLLIPLSETLNIDLYELLDGDKKGEISLEDGIKKVIQLSDSEIKMKNKSFVKKHILISSLCIIILLLFCFKLTYLFRYKISDKVINSYISSEKILVNTDKESKNEYIIYDGIKFKSIIQNFEEVIGTSSNENLKMYTCYDKGKEEAYTFSISKNKSLVSLIKENKLSIGINDRIYNSIDKQKLLKKNNISNDRDLIKFLVNNKNIKNDISTLWINIKENYYISELLELILGDESIFSYIDGDITGYVKNVYTKGHKEIHILVSEYDYTFLLSTNYFSDGIIKELLESIVIE